MSNKSRLSYIVAGLVFSVVQAKAVVLINADFNSDKTGRPPNASFVNKPEKTDLRIVDSESQPADPFGGAENRSLLTDDTGPASPDVGWSTDGFVNEKQDMTLSLKACFVNDGTFSNAYVIIQAGKNDMKARSSLTAIEAAVQLTIMGDRINARSGSEVVRLNQEPGVDFAWNAVWNVVINISPETKTWSAAINGVPLTKGSKDTFKFRDNPSVDGINFVGMTGQSAASGCRVFWDDVKLEVASAVTVGQVTKFWPTVCFAQ
ncbi:MAG: hypothetical protein IT583_07165 [Verrucomicrobia bacterium]|nr:hypothetical protein [Verrucomicrobiota bacterium]